jgi:hypothetical protein
MLETHQLRWGPYTTNSEHMERWPTTICWLDIDYQDPIVIVDEEGQIP